MWNGSGILLATNLLFSDAVRVALICLGHGLWGYLAAQIVSSVCILILLISFVWRLTPVECGIPNVEKLGSAGRSGRSLLPCSGLGSCGSSWCRRIGSLSAYTEGPHDVGVYAVVASLIAYETIFLRSVNQIFAPVIADIHSRGQHALLGRLFQTLTKWILGPTFPLAIVLIIYARTVMSIFGHEFEAGSAAPSLQCSYFAIESTDVM